MQPHALLKVVKLGHVMLCYSFDRVMHVTGKVLGYLLEYKCVALEYRICFRNVWMDDITNPHTVYEVVLATVEKLSEHHNHNVLFANTVHLSRFEICHVQIGNKCQGVINRIFRSSSKVKLYKSLSSGYYYMLSPRGFLHIVPI